MNLKSEHLRQGSPIEFMPKNLAVINENNLQIYIYNS
jgi:hypothetical protein